MARPVAHATEPATMNYTPSRAAFVVIRIAGYTWYKTYRTIEMLADSPSPATTRWLEHKQTELNFASLIGGLLASAVTASLSWPDIPTTLWLVRACWYVSLCMVITSVLVAFQQVAGLGGILATRGSHSSLYSALLDRNGRPDIKTVFVLQVPVQLLSYSIFFYTLGLAIHVIRPVASGVWGDNVKIAIFYSVGLVFSVALFMVGSHYSLQLLDSAPDMPARKTVDAVQDGEDSFSRRPTFVHCESGLEDGGAATDAPAETQQPAGGMGGLMLREVAE